jgi:AraC-like DNA-binding protein
VEPVRDPPFRELFREAWVIAVTPHEEQPASLLAVDDAHFVLGADCQARVQFKIDPESICAGISVWAIFGRNARLLQGGADTDYSVRLRSACGGEEFFALVSPPTRRRLRVPPRGGLAPGALRRVKEYIDGHLGEDLTLETLAALAGLSTHHFARAFKRSTGLPPHRCILQERIKRAAEMLRQTSLPLTAIAHSLGFTDQSHFSRSFRWHMGIAPRYYRRSYR